MVFSWAIGYAYFIAPENHRITPFIFTDRDWSLRWYIYQISNNLASISYAFVIYLFTKRINNVILRDISIINIIITIFALVWFVLFYNNPFSKGEVVIKVLAVAAIYFSIYSIRKKNDNRTDNNIFSRGNIRGID